jgi:hypothetical protein
VEQPGAAHEEDAEVPVDGVHLGAVEDLVTAEEEVDLGVDAEVDSVAAVEVVVSRGADPVEAVVEEALADADEEDTRPCRLHFWVAGSRRHYEGCYRYHCCSSALLGMGGVYTVTFQGSLRDSKIGRLGSLFDNQTLSLPVQGSRWR